LICASCSADGMSTVYARPLSQGSR
jgi:hypothetical protein